MYRNKIRKTSKESCVTGCDGDNVPHTGFKSSKLSVPSASHILSSTLLTPNTTRTNNEISCNTSKRKSLFDDLDLSDIKLDQSYRSFIDASHIKELDLSKDESFKISNKDESLGMDDLSDIELDDGELSIIVKNEKNSPGNISNLSEEDKNGIITALKLNSTTLSPFQASSLTSTPVSARPSNFRTVSGTRIKIDRASLDNAPKLFEPFERLLLMEIASYLWIENNPSKS
ncbi:hypothetical protein BLOT_016295 [Blomia tropicalis]|nr:hypothetical protein BLOT_016295 [Blomia tropicalis]